MSANIPVLFCNADSFAYAGGSGCVKWIEYTSFVQSKGWGTL